MVKELVANGARADEWRDHDSRDPWPETSECVRRVPARPVANRRRRHVIVEPAMLIIAVDEYGLLPALRVHGRRLVHPTQKVLAPADRERRVVVIRVVRTNMRPVVVRWLDDDHLRTRVNRLTLHIIEVVLEIAEVVAQHVRPGMRIHGET